MTMFGKKKEKSINATHFSGLEIPENAALNATLSDLGLTIKVPTLQKEYTLNLEKIQDVKYFNETEVEKYLDSSLAKAVIGATAFGAVGAIIGSRPKTKEKKIVHFYLLIDYSGKQIVLASDDGFSVGAMVDFFKKIKPESKEVQTIEL